MSDDARYGDPQEPVPGSAYAQSPGQGRRGKRAQQPEQQPDQSGQYAQPQYPQDPYQPNQYPQGYPQQPRQSYYEGQPDRDAGQGYQSPQTYQQNPQAYQQPPQGQPQPPRSQQPGQGQYPRRAQPPRPQQPAPQPTPRAAADPYASDPYASGTYNADPYASGSYSSGPGSYQTDPYASSSGNYTRGAGDTSGTGYPPSARDGYASGNYPTGSYASGSYPTGEYQSGSEYGTGEYSTGTGTGEYPVGGPPGRGRGRPAPAQNPQNQDPYGRRRAGGPTAAAAAAAATAAGPATTTGFAQYEDDDEFPARPSSSRRVPARDDARGTRDARDAGADPRSEGEPRSRRRGVPAREEEEDGGRFNLIDEEDGQEPGNGRGRKPKQKKGRNCLAVFIAFAIIAGGLGYGTYRGVEWYRAKYGPPPDYTSSVGTGIKIDVNIPDGAGGKTIGGLLFNAGVVKSQRAFTNACNANAKCASIQAGTYLLPKGLSAAAAVNAMLDPKNQDSKTRLITYGGERAAQIFSALEAKTGWKDADIRAAIAGGKIDLPAWDTGKPGVKFPYAHIEGFIASESYVLTNYKTPTDLLKKMVDDQLAMFSMEDLANKAKALNLTEYEALTIASLARAEAGTNTSDLNKIAGVVFNRFDNPASFAHLGFDTATLYGMGNTGTVPNNKDTANPYNTSVFGIKGLPPSPIDNPDQQALDAALNPNRDNKYFYFCATPDGVQYAQNNTQWQTLGTKYPGLCGSG